ncbi:MAG TPA: hypothetical protein VF533_17065, partial [Solirubrobacteraceae bacterium]
MNSTTASTTLDRLAAPAAMAASAALAVGGIIQLTDTQSSESTVVGVEHVTLGALTVLTMALIPVVLFLARLAGRPAAGFPAAAGLGLLAPLTVVSNLRGSDPAFFDAVAVPANLLWLVGFVVLGVVLKRSGRVPAAIAIGLPVSYFFMLPLATV